MEKAFSSFLLIVLLQLHYVMASSAMTQTNITTDQLALLSLKSQIVLDPSHFLDESRIPREFGNLSFLVSPDLGSNNFHGNLPQEMARLRQLKFLDLSFNNFRGVIPSWFGFLHQLQVLNLGNNSFTGSIPSSFSNMSTLETLNLNFNSIEGQIPKVIGSFINLRELRLRGNKLIGSIPLSLSNASRLETLDISFNSLQGNIPKGIDNLHSMKLLSIQANQLTGSIPFTIFNISRIEVIAFTGNSLSGYLPNGLCNGLPILKGLYLSGNKFHGHIPASLSNCSQLQLLSFSENDLTGEIPKEISNLIELEVLDLAFNSFSGPPEMEIFNISGLRLISLSLNNLSGSFPPIMCSILPNIEKLYLNTLTNLVGTIPHSISNCSKLTHLELSYNQLTGLIPNSLGYLTHLQLLNLGGNNLMTSMGNLSTSLIRFYANNCKIKGRIPNEVGNLSSLLFLYLSGNNLVGSIPTSIGNLRNLQRFNMKNNKLTGFVGDHICKLQHLGAIYLGQNQLAGSLPNCLGNITSIREIDLGSNKLSSNIPPSLGNLQDLVVFDLSSNNMVGSLPPEIGNLKAITKMDLSMNQPREIGGLQTLAYLSLRHNNLQGAIPDSMNYMVVVFAHLTIVLLLIRYRRGISAPPQADSLSTIAREKISYYELLRATDALSESNLIGSGSFGSVYKGVLSSGTVIAVEVLNLQLDAAFKSFDTECEVLRSLRHRNLVKVITSCSKLDFKALVLEYMPNGSLDKYLYSHNYFLDITQRLSLTLDVACVLEYLHHGCSSPVIHCDEKPSNVLLDEDMVSHLSDFGISKLLGEDESDLYTKTLATLGYIAPEFRLDGLVSTKCDVYSYGIVLLEMFTRRKPNEFEGNLSLKQWVSYSIPDAVMDVADANMLTSTGNCLKKELNVVASIIKVGLGCCNESPARRTNMKDVVGMLQKIKNQLLTC
ncbi:hypothetical protein T459_11270 [Capsicum annuum]|uniref:non-specific serine/threonine protein kinase n=2 Tax=Capsicum annuum TaxID=4072 RepID=A0A2G2ZLF5_CAPAN|nr:hypothetical protein T459_11270 [Capsicum annuum]